MSNLQKSFSLNLTEIMPKVYHVVMVAYSKCTKSDRPYAFTKNGIK